MEEPNTQNVNNLATVIDNLEVELSNFENLKKIFVNDSKFTEAEEAKNKICKLREVLKLKKLKYLELKFDFDIKYSEEKMKKELAELDTNWEVRFHEFQLNSQKLESDLNIRQNYEIVELTKQLELSMGKFIKYSNNYLDLKKQQENLIKQQFFKEANVVNKKLQNLEKVENENFMKTRNEKIKAKRDKLANKHVLEKNSFLKKRKDEEESFYSQKQQMHESISQKHRNRITELSTQLNHDKLINENENLYRSKISSNQSVKQLSNVMNPQIRKFQSPEAKLLMKIKKQTCGLTNDDYNFIKSSTN